MCCRDTQLQTGTQCLNYICVCLYDVCADGTAADADILPSSLSVDTPALSSALQVFSSVGGLALLAEHLPLLYPDFSRHSSPVDIVRDAANTNAGLSSTGVGLGHDWVTVESAEEIYEVLMSYTLIHIK